MKWTDIEIPSEAVGTISAAHSSCCRYCIKRRGQYKYVLFVDGVAESSSETLEQAKAEAERIKRIA